MQTHLKRLNKPELDFLKDNCIFSEEEIRILELSIAEKSDQQIADKLSMSKSTVIKKKKTIKNKIIDFLEVSKLVTTIYINGNRVTKEEIKDYEIQIEAVKQIIADKLTSKS
jgi:predicted DNA-binding protein (UPF0251 family)